MPADEGLQVAANAERTNTPFVACAAVCAVGFFVTNPACAVRKGRPGAARINQLMGISADPSPRSAQLTPRAVPEDAAADGDYQNRVTTVPRPNITMVGVLGPRSADRLSWGVRSSRDWIDIATRGQEVTGGCGLGSDGRRPAELEFVVGSIGHFRAAK